MGEVPQVELFGVVETQGAGDRIQHRVRRPGQVPALKVGVVLNEGGGSARSGKLQLDLE